MSVYQGFATRQQETTYFQLIERLVRLLSKRCLASIFSHPFSDEKWAREVQKTLKYIGIADENKYAYPRFSQVMQPFLKCISLQFGLNESRENSAMHSQISQNPPKSQQSHIRGRRNINMQKHSSNQRTKQMVESQQDVQSSLIENTLSLKAYFNHPESDNSWGSIGLSGIVGSGMIGDSSLRFKDGRAEAQQLNQSSIVGGASVNTTHSLLDVEMNQQKNSTDDDIISIKNMHIFNTRTDRDNENDHLNILENTNVIIPNNNLKQDSIRKKVEIVCHSLESPINKMKSTSKQQIPTKRCININQKNDALSIKELNSAIFKDTEYRIRPSTQIGLNEETTQIKTNKRAATTSLQNRSQSNIRNARLSNITSKFMDVHLVKPTQIETPKSISEMESRYKKFIDNNDSSQYKQTTYFSSRNRKKPIQIQSSQNRDSTSGRRTNEKAFLALIAKPKFVKNCYNLRSPL